MRKEGANSGDANLVNGGTTATESFKIERFIGGMEYDDKAFVNNRWSSLEGMTIREMGAMARRLPGDLAFGILLSNPNMADGNPLFYGANALTTSPLNQANVKIAWKAMNTQQQDGVDLGVIPTNLLVSATNKFDADAILNSTYMVGGSSATPSKNTTEGLMKPIWDRRIDNGVLDHNALVPLESPVLRRHGL